MKKWAKNLCFDFLYNLIWNISHYKTKLDISKWMWKILHVIYPSILSHFNETNMHIVYTLNHLSNVTPPHISPANKLIFPLTDYTQKISTKFSTVRSTIYRFCGHLQLQCAACSTVDMVRALVWGGAQTGRTSGKCWFVMRFMICTVHVMLFRLRNQEIWDN